MSDAAERVRAHLPYLTQLSEGMQFLAALDAVHALLAVHDAHAAAVAALQSRLEEEVCASIGLRAALASAREEREADRAEVERLRAVLRWTHTSYCTPAWSDRGLHAPECLLYEVEP